MSQLRAQVSVEFLVITAVSLSVLAASALTVYGFVQDSGVDAAYQQAGALGSALIANAMEVRSYGSGTFFTVTANLPPEISGITIFEGGSENDAIIFEVSGSGGTSQVPVFTSVDIGGVDYTTAFAAGQVSNLVIPPDEIGSTNVEFRLTSRNGYVEVAVK